jgi:hypothetical protein
MIESSSLFFGNWIDIAHATFTLSAPFLFICTTCIGLYSPSWNCPKETAFQIISLQTPGISVSANISYVVTMFTFCLAYKNDLGLSAVISSWIQYTLHRQTNKKLRRKKKLNDGENNMGRTLWLTTSGIEMVSRLSHSFYPFCLPNA